MALRIFIPGLTKKILAGHGFGLEDNRVAIETVSDIRNSVVVSGGEMHPFVGTASK